MVGPFVVYLRILHEKLEAINTLGNDIEGKPKFSEFMLHSLKVTDDEISDAPAVATKDVAHIPDPTVIQIIDATPSPAPTPFLEINT